jgi:hypothetical protein
MTWKNIEKINMIEHIGFVYKITNTQNNMIYFGKKLLHSTRTKKLTKKELIEIPVKRGKRPVSKKVTSESNWINYYGSSKKLLADIKETGEQFFEREILYACFNKQSLSYLETRVQMEHRVLENSDKFYNDNILGKFFPSKVNMFEQF